MKTESLLTEIMDRNPEMAEDIADCLNFEFMILGKIVYENEVIDSLAFLKPEHFHSRYHREIYQSMLDLRAIEEVISPYSLAPLVEVPGGVMKYLQKASVSSFSLATGPEVVAIAEKIIEYSKRRDLALFLTQQAAELQEGRKFSIEVIAEIQKQIHEIGFQATTAKFFTKRQVGDRILRRLDNRPEPFSTGIRALDKAMDGGMYPGMCYLFAGRKKMGKTTLAGTVSSNLNRELKRHLYIACEMSQEEIEQRNLARATQSYASHFRTDYGRGEDFKNKIFKAVQEEPDEIIYLDSPSIAFNDLKAAVAQAVVQFGIKGFILDCLQLVGGKPARKSQAEHQDDVGQWCATFARQHGLFSIVLAQVNQTGNIRGGEGVRMACDMAFEIHAPEDDPSRSERWLEMIETRYTGWADVGSKENCVLSMHENGPYIYERFAENEPPLPF